MRYEEMKCRLNTNGLPRNKDGHTVSPRYVPEHQTDYLAKWREWMRANPYRSKWPQWLIGDIQLMKASGRRSTPRSDASTPGSDHELG